MALRVYKEDDPPDECLCDCEEHNPDHTTCESWVIETSDGTVLGVFCNEPGAREFARAYEKEGFH